MNVDQALDVVHQARKRLDGDCARADCAHCAAITLASEVRRQQAEIRQLGRLIDAQKAPVVVVAARCRCCGSKLIDGLCGHCDC